MFAQIDLLGTFPPYILFYYAFAYYYNAISLSLNSLYLIVLPSIVDNTYMQCRPCDFLTNADIRFYLL